MGGLGQSVDYSFITTVSAEYFKSNTVTVKYI